MQSRGWLHGRAERGSTPALHGGCCTKGSWDGTAREGGWRWRLGVLGGFALQTFQQQRERDHRGERDGGQQEDDGREREY
jgi:hypothetical protein